MLNQIKNKSIILFIIGNNKKEIKLDIYSLYYIKFGNLEILK